MNGRGQERANCLSKRKEFMKRAMRVATAAVLSILFVETARADGTVGVTAKAGTLGLGGDVTIPIVQSNLNFRAGYNRGNLKLNVDLDEATCQGDFKFETIPILLDWHPWAGEFRFSGGLVINDNKVDLSATPKEDFKLNGNSYAIDGMKGSIKFNQVAGYIGIGSGNAVGDGRLHMALDLGVMIQGKPKSKATATAADPALQNAMNSDLQVEVNKFQKDHLDAFIIYPVLSIGISFTF